MKQKHTENEDVVISPKQYSDCGMLKVMHVLLKSNELPYILVCQTYFVPLITEILSENSSSEESDCLSDLDSSDSLSSDSFEDLSYSDLSPEDEDMEDGDEDDRSAECIMISSDEELMELEPPTTSSAPHTPGSQLELGLQDWLDPFCREEPEENQYTGQQGLDIMMELQTREPQDLHPPSPIGLSGHISSVLCSSRWKYFTTEDFMSEKIQIGPHFSNFLPPSEILKKIELTSKLFPDVICYWSNSLIFKK